MARGGIYKSEVLRARERLLAQGRYPSIDAVRAELGDTGSKTTIHRYLKEIEEEQGSPAGSQGRTRRRSEAKCASRPNSAPIRRATEGESTSRSSARVARL